MIARWIYSLVIVFGVGGARFVAQAEAPMASLERSQEANQEINNFKQRVVGTYGHFDVVAYAERIFLGEMRTLVITYGITELFLDEQGDLIARDRFCHASHKANLPFRSRVPDAFTRAIVPRLAKVEIRDQDGVLSLWRPATPTPIGIRLDNPSVEPLPMNPKDPRISDDDHDGKPGVTVKIRIYNLFDTELYIARREIFAYALRLQANGDLTGYVSDHSEQLVVGSPLPLLRSQRNPAQAADSALSPMVLTPIDPSYDCDRLMLERDALFPPEPEVW